MCVCVCVSCNREFSTPYLLWDTNMICVCVCVWCNREFSTPYLLCDCSLRWLQRWVTEHSVTVKDTRCSYPRSLKGQLATDVQPESLTCGRTSTLPTRTETQTHTVISNKYNPSQSNGKKPHFDVQGF